MKKIFLVLSCITIAMASCSNDSSKSNEESNATTTTTESTAPATSSASDLPGKKLIAKSDCLGCHNETQKVVGPAYVDVAEKYPMNDENIAHLADKIIGGGKGVWGEVPMTAHPTLAPDDAKEMVKYILSLKK
jgi:cytochrome c